MGLGSVRRNMSAAFKEGMTEAMGTQGASDLAGPKTEPGTPTGVMVRRRRSRIVIWGGGFIVLVVALGVVATIVGRGSESTSPTDQFLSHVAASLTSDNPGITVPSDATLLLWGHQVCADFTSQSMTANDVYRANQVVLVSWGATSVVNTDTDIIDDPFRYLCPGEVAAFLQSLGNNGN
jgi:hypothetical protein